MSDPRFDLTYTGLVAPGADPEQTRQRLTAVFKLSDKGAERLFTGRPVVVRRNVDAGSAARFKRIFAQAGAILTITPVEDATEPDDSGITADSAAPPETPETPERGPAPLALAAQFEALETPPIAEPLNWDTSYLSLVVGDNWTLEDCEPPPTPIPEPDTTYLSLVPQSADDNKQPPPDWI